MKLRIREKLNERKWYYRIISLTLVFSMLCSFIIPLGLIKPVFTAEGDGTSPTPLYFESVQTTPRGEKITSYNYEITTNKGALSAGSPIQAGSDTSVDISMQMDYKFNTKTDVDKIIANGGYIYYVLPSNFTFDQNFYGSDCKVKDQKYANEKWGGADVPSGYYSIWNGVNDKGEKPTPIITIHFTPDYIKYLTGKSYLEGTIKFNGKVNRADTVEGDQIVAFADGPTVEVDFAKDKVTIRKENASVKTDNDGNKYFEWKITVNNPSGRTDLTGYTLSDTLNGEAFDFSANCTVEPSGDGSFVGGNFVFGGKGKGQYQETYTFTYRQSDPVAGTDYNNEATLTGGDTPETSSGTGKIEDKLEVTKDGKPDYQATGDRNGLINWKITLENKSGDSLAAAQAFLADPAFANVTVKNGQVKFHKIISLYQLLRLCPCFYFARAFFLSVSGLSMSL